MKANHTPNLPPSSNGHTPIEVTVAHLEGFDDIIDVRSESEYEEDHLPGAVNFPVLNDQQRIEVGTIYKQVGAFEAKKLGAVWVSQNIARHLQQSFSDKPRQWRPLIYCWRGGGRSGAMAHVFSQIGWKVGRLSGGYKQFRTQVLLDLETLPSRYPWTVVCGMTGTGKSRFLQSLKKAGAQVLDLENLAAHRGSVLGDLPDQPQPSQKFFDTQVWQALRGFDPQKTVYVEAESKKIGMLHVPDALIRSMWGSPTINLETPIAVRVEILKEEYAHFLENAQSLKTQLHCLRALHGNQTTTQWMELIEQQQWDALTEQLLIQHYDPSYTKAIYQHYPNLEQSVKLSAHSALPAHFDQLAIDYLQQLNAAPHPA